MTRCKAPFRACTIAQRFWRKAASAVPLDQFEDAVAAASATAMAAPPQPASSAPRARRWPASRRPASCRRATSPSSGPTPLRPRPFGATFTRPTMVSASGCGLLHHRPARLLQGLAHGRRQLRSPLPGEPLTGRRRRRGSASVRALGVTCIAPSGRPPGGAGSAARRRCGVGSPRYCRRRGRCGRPSTALAAGFARMGDRGHRARYPRAAPRGRRAIRSVPAAPCRGRSVSRNRSRGAASGPAVAKYSAGGAVGPRAGWHSPSGRASRHASAVAGDALEHHRVTAAKDRRPA